MADTKKNSRTTKTSTPRTKTATRHSDAEATSGPGTESRADGPGQDDGDIRAQIARRAYAISQSESAGSAEDNWIRAEREVHGRTGAET